MKDWEDSDIVEVVAVSSQGPKLNPQSFIKRLSLTLSPGTHVLEEASFLWTYRDNHTTRNWHPYPEPGNRYMCGLGSRCIYSRLLLTDVSANTCGLTRRPGSWSPQRSVCIKTHTNYKITHAGCLQLLSSGNLWYTSMILPANGGLWSIVMVC